MFQLLVMAASCTTLLWTYMYDFFLDKWRKEKPEQLSTHPLPTKALHSVCAVGPETFPPPEG